MKRNWLKKTAIAIGIVSLISVGVIAFSGLVMLLWNNILPGVLHVSTITLWQAAGILLLSKILFGGFKGRRGMHGGCGGWKKKQMFMKWQRMTPEEREQFRNNMHCRRGFGRSEESVAV